RQFSVRNERGIALVIAIVALVVIGAIVAGTFFISTLEQRTSFNTVQTTQAFEAAEAGMQGGMGNWDGKWETPTAGTSSPWYTTSSFGGSSASYKYTVRNLNDQIYLLKSEGSKDGATQTLASLVRLVTTPVNVGAAVTSGGNAQVGGNASIDGRDTIPAGWTRSPACPHSPDKAGIRASGTIGTNGNPSIYGTPAKVEHDAGVTTDLFQSPFQQLKQQATLSFAGGNGQGNYVTFPTVAPTATGS